MSVNNSPQRIGYFTSSEIVALTKPCKSNLEIVNELKTECDRLQVLYDDTANKTTKVQVGRKDKIAAIKNEIAQIDINGITLPDTALTYIEETKWERKLHRSLSTELNTRPLVWGKVCEAHVNNITPTDYQVNSNDVKVHPDFSAVWSGTQDGIRHFEKELAHLKTVVEIKCLWTLTSFCRLASCVLEWDDVEYKPTKVSRYAKDGWECMQRIRGKVEDVKKHNEGETWYWQIVSNAILNDVNYGELLFYCPFQDELNDIREVAQQYDGDMPLHALYFIGASNSDEDFPYLVRGGEYNNINIIRFEIPQADKDFLIERVKLASTFLK